MTVRNLEHAFDCRSVALIGASPQPGSVGRTVFRNLLGGGFSGDIWPVNPKYTQIDGVDCYPAVTDLPAVPDLAVIATPAVTVPQLISELGARGTRTAVVLSAGLSAASGMRQAMLDTARPTCFRIIGPNCLGLFVPHLGLNASFAHLAPNVGNLGFFSQSGAIISAVLDWAVDRQIGFSTIVSLGDMADVDVADLVDLLAGDHSTHAILLYLESVPHARKFMSAARAAARIKPVIVIKSGRHAAAAKAAATHTGALAGADRVVDAAFVRAGLLRVHDLEDLFDAAETLSRFRPVEHGNLAIVTNGGGAGVLAVDRLMDHDGILADLSDDTMRSLDAVLPPTWSRSNPVDIIGDGGPERYQAAIDRVLGAPEVDSVLVMCCPTALASSTDAAEAVVSALDANDWTSGSRKPVFATWLGDHTAERGRQILRNAGIASFETPADAVKSLGYLSGYRRAQQQLSRTPPALPDDFHVDRRAAGAAMTEARSEGRPVLTEPEAKALLSAYGITSVETHIAHSVSEVGEIAALLTAKGENVAVKLLSRDISHKSDVGGVALDLMTAANAARAAADIKQRIASERPEARLDGFTVQPMIRRPGAHELIAGLDEDRLFGPIVLFGAGGTAVEVIEDSAVALPPLDLKLARDLISSTRISKLLAGYRNRSAANLDEVALTLVRLSQLSVDFPEIVSLDINPLLADSSGVIALDARVVIDPAIIASDRPNPRLAIRPYPSEWVSEITTAGGLQVTLRPIRPADESLYPDFLTRLTDRDVRLRLLAPRKSFTHQFLARLTQIDYARDMAFVAIASEDDALLGVARLASDPDHTEAEFAIIVRSDLKGRGLGRALMEHLIAFARADRLKMLKGIVLAENEAMLAMAAGLGFSATPDPGNPGCMAVQIDLTPVPT